MQFCCPQCMIFFMSYVEELRAGRKIETEVKSISARWILSNLTANLQQHISCSCPTRKHGTLLFRPNSDLKAPLTEALWKVRNLQVNGGTTENYSEPALKSPDARLKRMVFDELNEQIHMQIKLLLAKDAKTPFDYRNLNIDQFIQESNSEVWEAILLLTRSVSDRRRTSKSDDPTRHTKTIRQFYLLCTLLFCTDERCSMPLHTLLADMVESQGGTQLLIKILNRFGVCSSSDTLSRYIQYRVNLKMEKPAISSESFMVVSADNIDFLHSYARVYCGNQASGWHGTSIQAVHPIPSLSQCEYNIDQSHPANQVSLYNGFQPPERVRALTGSQSLTLPVVSPPNRVRALTGSQSLTLPVVSPPNWVRALTGSQSMTLPVVSPPERVKALTESQSLTLPVVSPPNRMRALTGSQSLTLPVVSPPERVRALTGSQSLTLPVVSPPNRVRALTGSQSLTLPVVSPQNWVRALTGSQSMTLPVIRPLERVRVHTGSQSLTIPHTQSQELA